MEENISNIELNRKLMKSFFSVKESLAALRSLGTIPFETSSVEDYLNLIVQMIDTFAFLRRNQTVSKKTAKLNPGMRSVTPSFSNIGGLVRVNFAHEDLPYTEAESKYLFKILEDVLHLKKFLIDGIPLPVFEDRKEPQQVVSNRKKKRANKHAFYFRRKKR